MARDKNLEKLKQKQLEKEMREQETETQMEMTDSGEIPDLQDDTEGEENQEKK
ncbi:hypothetical protein [Planococcus sp. ISL-110]|uniref:hypothetical protein n=1 Tax=Planococcus sp. ISL-110 TaxID=2819167 RepID=UPI001BE768A2|nr:hypothetical protein [Planococcus sp. ISL-110]MBT2570706.1 hypothetical protein [Planococcus sp. ISL-110]